MADFTMGQGSRRPTLAATLTENGSPLDLTDAEAVTFRGRRPDGTTVFSGACTVDVDPETGKVTYAWGVADTATPGLYNVDFLVTWVDAVVGPPAVPAVTQTIPTNRRAVLEIRQAST